MRFLFSVIANRDGEQFAEPDEMEAIDAFNDKIEADDVTTAHALALEASKACNRLIEVRQIFH